MSVPTEAPSSFAVTAISSTSISASWKLPPEDFRHGIITGFKLFAKRKGSDDLTIILLIDSASILTKTVNGLDAFTEYEFQVLASTSVGDGPKSSVKVAKTSEGGKRDF